MPLSDEHIDDLIEKSDGYWLYGEYRIHGTDLSNLVRAIESAVLQSLAHEGREAVPEQLHLDESRKESVVMPCALTAENGAKAALIGEFYETEMHQCPICAGDDEDVGGCNCCNGEGEVVQKIPVQWDTIKRIYAKAVDLFAKPAPPEQASGEDRFCDSHCTHIDHHPGCVRGDTADGGEERK